MGVKVERTKDEILIKLPPDTDMADVQQVLNYFNYVELVGNSEATQEEIDELAKESKKGWWEANKDRFKNKPGFEDLTQ